MSFDVAAARRRFSALQADLVFFDGPGGTQCPDEVIDAIATYLRESNANVSGPYEHSRRTEALVERSRETAAGFLGCSPEEVVFGDLTTGAESDIQQLTQIARHMVGRWGMSSSIGTIAVLPADGAGPLLPGPAGARLGELVGEGAPQCGQGKVSSGAEASSSALDSLSHSALEGSKEGGTSFPQVGQGRCPRRANNTRR